MALLTVPDVVHGKVELSLASAKIVDTLEFQRLRSLKHLGLLEYIYPSANYDVFSHALGAAHLAREWLSILKKAQAELDITELDVLCVEVAALCLNLGLRPYSRYWGDILENVLGEENVGESFSEVEMSAFIFHRIFNKYEEVQQAFQQFGLRATHRAVIEQLITGKPVDKRLGGPVVSPKASGSKFIGVPDSKMFLFDIVRNKKNHIDVGTLDLAARACRTVGVHDGDIPVIRILEESRVLSHHVLDKGCADARTEHQEIIFSDEVVLDIQEIFQFIDSIDLPAAERGSFVAIGRMFVDAVLATNSLPFVRISQERSLTLAQAASDPEGIHMMTDDRVFDSILDTSTKELSSCRDILMRIVVRDLYKTIAVINPERGEDPETEDPRTSSQKARAYEEHLKRLLQQFAPSSVDAVVVNFVRNSYCKEGHLLWDDIRFFHRSDPTSVRSKHHETGFLCSRMTVAYYVLCRNPSAIEDVRMAVKKLALTSKCHKVITFIKEVGEEGTREPVPLLPDETVVYFSDREKVKVDSGGCRSKG